MISVLEFPHPSLMTTCVDIAKVDTQLLEWIKEMRVLYTEHKAAGLAANQVGLPYRMFVMDGKVFINPVVKLKSSRFSVQPEGCVSLPGVYVEIPRCEKVGVFAYDEVGNEINKVFTGIQARIIQHECDHLDGLMFFNRVDPTTVGIDFVNHLNSLQIKFSAEHDADSIASIQSELEFLKSERGVQNV